MCNYREIKHSCGHPSLDMARITEYCGWRGGVNCITRKDMTTPTLQVSYKCKTCRAAVNTHRWPEFLYTEIPSKSDREAFVNARMQKFMPNTPGAYSQGAVGGEVVADDKNIKDEDVKIKDEDVKMKVEDVKIKVEDAKIKVEDVKTKVEDVKIKVEDAKIKVEDVKAKVEDVKIKVKDVAPVHAE
jgi:hypothetical protein